MRTLQLLIDREINLCRATDCNCSADECQLNNIPTHPISRTCTAKKFLRGLFQLQIAVYSRSCHETCPANCTNYGYPVLDIGYSGTYLSTQIRSRDSFGANGRAHKWHSVYVRSTCLTGVLASHYKTQ